METILIINALLLLVEKLLPKVTELANGGVITKEKQAEIRARYDAIKNNLDVEFGGDHWKVRPDPVADIPKPIITAKSAKHPDGADC